MSDYGRYIVVEGLEGAGKSSAIETICSVLNNHNIEYTQCREPGGTPIAESLRQIIKGQFDNSEPLFDETELLLMYAARKQLLDTLIKPTLESGKWVISDRNEWSSITYQGYGRGLDLNFIYELSKFTVGNLQPDRIVYLEIDPVVGLKRASLRGEYDRIEQESLIFFRNRKNIAEMISLYRECVIETSR